MRNIKDIINEAHYGRGTTNEKRAIVGNVLEVELNGDGHFFWHTPKDSDWKDSKFDEMKDWEIWQWGDNAFVVKIGKLEDLE